MAMGGGGQRPVRGRPDNACTPQWRTGESSRRNNTSLERVHAALAAGRLRDEEPLRTLEGLATLVLRSRAVLRSSGTRARRLRRRCSGNAATLSSLRATAASVQLFG